MTASPPGMPQPAGRESSIDVTREPADGPSARAEAETKCHENVWEEMGVTPGVWGAFLEDGDSQVVFEVTVY